MQKKIVYATICMSQADQNFLKDYLKSEINWLERHISELQEAATAVWPYCNPSDPDTNEDYKYLNLMKRNIRYGQKRLKKLRRVQQAVKQCYVDNFDVIEMPISSTLQEDNV